MDVQFYGKCFLVGLSAASAVGPIFVLTFNRGAWYGFSRGFATALGAACGDGFLFFLGLLGVLQLLGEYRGTILAMDLVGGFFLIMLGVRSFKGRQKYVNDPHVETLPPISTSLKSFFLTVANPLTVLFFMVIGVRILPDDGIVLPFRQVVFGSMFVASGSLTVLSTVAFTASRLGLAISERRLRTISHVTGVMFLGIGVYFFGDFVVRILKMVGWI
jgi:threonine/homoserine/homoserine lactone efflux protein